MKSTTHPLSTRARTALVGVFLAATTVTLAGPAAAAPAAPAPTVIGVAPDQTKAEELAAAIEAIPTETIAMTAAMERRLATQIVSRTAHRKAKGPKKAKRPARSRGAGALAAARTQAGDSYAYGAAGPNAYDCSGLTGWAYRQVGKNLPRTSGAQAGATMRVSRPAIGDLVFYHSNGNVYHVGLYAGGGNIFHASRPGTPVGLAKMWPGARFFGRVR